MLVRILYDDLGWATVRNRRQWISASPLSVQVCVDDDGAHDWQPANRPAVRIVGDIYPSGNPSWIASGVDFYVWEDGQDGPAVADLANVAAYLGQSPTALSMDALQAAGVKLGANVNREQWAVIQSTVWTDPNVPQPPGFVVPTPEPGGPPLATNIVCVAYFSDRTRAVITDRTDWATAPATGLVATAFPHRDLGWYSEGAPEVKQSSRVSIPGWSLLSGGIETWPLTQPRPWQTDVCGMWQDLISDGHVSTADVLESLNRSQLLAAGVKFWEDMPRETWEQVRAMLMSDDDTLLPKWGRRRG